MASEQPPFRIMSNLRTPRLRVLEVCGVKAGRASGKRAKPRESRSSREAGSRGRRQLESSALDLPPAPSRRQRAADNPEHARHETFELAGPYRAFDRPLLRRWIGQLLRPFRGWPSGPRKTPPKPGAADGMGRQLPPVSKSVQSNLPLYVTTILTVCSNTALVECPSL